METEMKEQRWTWGFLEGVAADRPQWRSLVAALRGNLREEELRGFAKLKKSKKPKKIG